MQHAITTWRFILLAASLVLSATRRGIADVKPADTITKDNIAQAEELLTPVTRWMVERGMPMQIIETKKVHWPKAYQEATEKYAKQVKLAADGREIFDYVAGCPFPSVDINDPLAGYKVMWNREHGPGVADNVGAETLTELVNSKGEVERTFMAPRRRLMWTGRLYLDPKPTISHSPAVHYTSLVGPVALPDAYKGASVLYFRYLSAAVPDDTYGYSPETRQVSLIGIANRGDTSGGSDVDIDSRGGFSAKLSFWTFRILAEKDVLAVVHSGKYGDRSVWCASRDGQHGLLAAFPCVPWEKRRVWVIEGSPTGYPRPYAYAKRILYIDEDFFGSVVAEAYDQHGELWRGGFPCLFYTQKPYEGYPVRPIEGGKYNYTEAWPFVPNEVWIDIQQGHATTFDTPPGYARPSEWLNEWYFNEPVSSNLPQVYSTNYLIQSAR